jgi:hypothetical protein
MTHLFFKRTYKNAAFAIFILALLFSYNAQSAGQVTTPAARTEVKVSEKTLSQYVGEYELQPGFTLTVTQEGTRLFAQGTGQQKVEVYPESETKFFLKVVEAQIEFAKDASGKVSKLTLYQNGQVMDAKKIK